MRSRKKYRFQNASVIISIALIYFLTACNFENRNTFFNNGGSHSDENRVVNSYVEYIHEISSPEFPLSSFKSNSDLYKDTIYTTKFHTDYNLQYFPATLWQLYSLNGNSDWKKNAENYSGILSESNIDSSNTNGELIQNVFLTPYLITGDSDYYSSFINVLSSYISYSEERNDKRKVSVCENDDCIEKLLENQVLFFASRETGDPVYSELALTQSEQIFNHYFNNQSNELYYGLANWNVLPGSNEITKLCNQDFYNLALCFYGFTTLHNERGNEKYYVSSVRLAKMFSNIYENLYSDNKEVQKLGEAIAKKIDLISQAMVCLALNNLSDDFAPDYKVVSDKIFQGILHELERTARLGKEQYSFRMYYYLFEYLKRNKKDSVLSTASSKQY